MELWRASLTDQLGNERFVHGNMSRSRAGVLRGMHFHERGADVWVLLEGLALAATTDLRPLLAGTSKCRREPGSTTEGGQCPLPSPSRRAWLLGA
jgi:hypothetical protein